jgi:thioredoxin reductase (NADPH)
MGEMRAQAERFGAELVADDVVKVDLTGDTKVVMTATHTFRARAVVLAMGSGYRKLGIPGENMLRSRRQLVRDLRRVLFPRPARRGRGRW